MSLALDRQQRLDPILADLKKEEGFGSVQSDDWDSAAINVFLELLPAHTGASLTKGNAIYKFARHLNSYRGAIRRVMKKHGVDYKVLSWPQKKYVANGSIYGKQIKSDEGYDQSHIKIEVFV